MLYFLRLGGGKHYIVPPPDVVMLPYAIRVSSSTRALDHVQSSRVTAGPDSWVKARVAPAIDSRALPSQR